MFPRYLLIGLLFVSVGLADPGLPDDFEATYHSLAGMIDVETLTPLEMAKELEQEYGADLFRYGIQGNYVVGIVLATPLPSAMLVTPVDP